MIVKKNKNKIMKEFSNGNLDDIEIISPNIADRVMQYADQELGLDKIINDNIDIKTHVDSLKPEVFFYGLLSSKLKRLFSVTEAIVAITSIPIINKFGLNIKSKKEFTTEGNMRKFINKIGTFKGNIEEKIKERISKINEKNKKEKNEEKKISIDESEIRNEVQIKENGHQFVKLFNKIMKTIISKINFDEPKIHILDCVKMVTTLENNNFELSTVINYEGKPLRGYKMGVLRLLTKTGGLIEYLIDDTITTNDITVTETEISKFNGFEEGDYILMDRGFAKIEFIISLIKRCINVIIPVKKNMDIYKECVKLATATKDGWKKHPNSKRKGQEIKLVKDLKGLWIQEKDKTKKPEKVMKNAVDFVGCVVRIDKSVKENKDIIEATRNADDETDEMYEDNKYIYIVILSTNLELSASQIIRYYELRPEIEEDFRQLKDIWKICTFTSTKYVFVMCQICMTFLAYNLFNMFKTSESGKKYIGKSMKKIANEEQRDLIPFHEAHYVISSGEYYGVFSGVELLDMYADAPKIIREKIKQLMVT